MNEFSLICRILGSLYNRSPADPVMQPLLTVISEGKLQQQWPLEQDELLAVLQKSCDLPALEQDYRALFGGEVPAVSPFGSDWEGGPQQDEVRTFLQQRGMPLSETPANHFGVLLLATSWLEDQSQEDEYLAQMTVFEQFLLPWCGAFLGKTEANAETAFYRSLAGLTRGAIQAMYEELSEQQQEPR
ncbi:MULTISPECIES: molecular chaperone [Tatumella]|uniref:Molecular chaperone n=1 Tax=Tatumella punctata TaxID=399969 RepID=A0ABW1VSS5_9GAMM|nr:MULTISPECIES: molecular chaperone [unclassified Tatumella]MBS0856012.1 molecular chaperone [Tatumella sp. JGM16]MBS0878071.1 molecular chaperone [Tatumella sp. JGM82]MBS0890430.1 molecular chaperone [Tatumella sp. JGM94]MBS0894681.1 molecular chaperone [Tatumella sp. JGM130]MBS0900886.1 molecular chaperone [Tatumella sp. JGM100]